ncbi:tetratricopeptide repeat protein [candidate division KSB1 bacterium]|nr:tetratricopeptide repeat protein [candidate division KSB1 bacterium]
MNSRILSLMLLGVLLALGCARMRSDTIPLTTNSAEAKQHFLKGMEYAECAKRDAARAEFAAAAMIDSDFAMAYAGLSMVQPNAGEMVEVASQAETMSRPEERSKPARSGFGIRIDAFAGNKVSSDLVGQATKRINKVSDGERLWILSLQAQLNADRRAQFEACSTLAAHYPKDERAHRLLGDCYAEAQQYDEAIAEYQRAIALKPACPAAYNMLGYYCVRKGDMKAAEQAFKRQTEILPGEANPRDSFAEFLLTQGRYAESLDNYKQALALDPGFVNARVGAATNLMMLGRHDEAVPYLVRAGDDSLAAEAWGLLKLAKVFCCYDRGDHEQALKLMREQVEYSRAAQSPYETVQNLNMLGRMLLVRRQFADAKQVFQEQKRECDAAGFPAAIRRRQEAVQAAVNGCIYEAVSGDVAAARHYADKLSQLVATLSDPYFRELSHFCTGLVEYHDGHYAQAVTELAQSSPLDAFNLYYLGLAYEKSGDLAKARESFERASVPKMLNNLNFYLARPDVAEALRRTAAFAEKDQPVRT